MKFFFTIYNFCAIEHLVSLEIVHFQKDYLYSAINLLNWLQIKIGVRKAGDGKDWNAAALRNGKYDVTIHFQCYSLKFNVKLHWFAVIAVTVRLNNFYTF